MSRELKFKGVHPKTKTVMGVFCIDWMHDEVWFEQGTDVAYSINECDLRQYIGLKDINGVEIYEKDKVMWGHLKGSIERTPRKAIVEMSPEIAFMTYNLEHNHRFGFSNFMYEQTHKTMEVII